jgi:hypothetical protein
VDVRVHDVAQARVFDRRLFAIAAVLFPLIVLVGFARTYYLRGLFEVPPLPSAIVHVHGIVMTAWVALFVAQVWLVSSRRIRVHQRLGYAGVALGAAIIASGIPTALRAAKYGSNSTPPGVSGLAFLAVPLFDLVMFALFFGAALYHRRRPAVHKRLMLLTAINFLPPALARIPVAPLQSLGPLWFFGFPAVVALLCVGLDARRNGLNRILLTGTILLVASYVARLAIMGTDAWMRLATWLTSYV